MKRCDQPSPTPIGRRRGGIRRAAAARARRSVEAVVQPVNRIPVYALLDPDAEEAIHQASMRILEEIGVDFRGDSEALALWRTAGAEVEGERVRIPRELAMAQLALAPDRFTQHARNPARSVEIGGPNLVLAPVYGPPYVRDLDGTRRRGTLEDLENFIKLAYRLPALNHSGGIVCEPQDVPVPKRHLEIFRAHVRHSDMPFMGAVNAPERAMDCVEMARIVFGGAGAGGIDDGATGTGGADAGERTALIALVNGNSPLVWDATMLGAMKVYARHRQALLVSPFIMQGANTPVTTAGALAQLNAEAVAGMAFAQLVRPGTPGRVRQHPRHGVHAIGGAYLRHRRDGHSGACDHSARATLRRAVPYRGHAHRLEDLRRRRRRAVDDRHALGSARPRALRPARGGVPGERVVGELRQDGDGCGPALPPARNRQGPSISTTTPLPSTPSAMSAPPGTSSATATPSSTTSRRSIAR